MKRLRIEHATGYTYEGEVAASYNEARMLPSSSDTQFVLSSQLDIEPATSVNQYVDYFGTRVVAFDIPAPHDRLRLVARSLVEVRPRPLAMPETTWDEMTAEASRSIGTVEMLEQSPRTAPPAEVVELARELAAGHTDPGRAALAILLGISEKVEYVRGSTSVHTTAVEAWEQRAGVCQDIVHLVLGALRSVGIPARYISGYLHPDPDAEIGARTVGESHAWVEWFAGGWHGFDPTNGSEIEDRHVRVGRGRDYNDVPPLRGVYAGPFTSTLNVEVMITREA